MPYNFVSFLPKKQNLELRLKLPQSDDVDGMIEGAGLDQLEYNARWNLYRLRLTSEDLKAKAEVVAKLMKLAHDRRAAS